ncbi:hypothetical protein RAS1_38850 [Phycisphaerae bacterium RAS1]|nr:hypothetical protein RAS1_38850 [Phycisphaerae bacterium RAS1]
MKAYRPVSGLVLAALVALPALGQSLPGYELIDITHTPDWFERGARLNTHGQVVFARRYISSDDRTTEIMLWDNGVLTQLTNDFVRDEYPDINDEGTIVWSRGVGPGESLEVVVLHDGLLTQLTNDTARNWGTRINSAGHIVWYKWRGAGCGNASADVCLYDGGEVITLVGDGWSNQVPSINDAGDVVWTKLNFCNSPPTGDVYRYRDGVITRLSNELSAPGVAALSRNGDVAWAQRKPPLYDWEIEIWRNGVITPFASGGGGVLLNDRGDVFFDRWHDDSQTWQVWHWRDGLFEQVTTDPYWNYISGLNDRGDFVWHARDPFATDIRFLRRHAVGDVTCDGTIDALDVSAFILALADPVLYSVSFPSCDAELADMNEDGCADILDINPFVDAIAH